MLCTYRSIPVEPPHPQVEDHEEDDGGEEGGGVPAELLERASTVCSSVGCSSSEWEEEEREELATPQQSGLQSQGGQGTIWSESHSTQHQQAKVGP